MTQASHPRVWSCAVIALYTSGSEFPLPSHLSSRQLGLLSVFLRRFIVFCVDRCPQVITMKSSLIGGDNSTICIGKAVGMANSNVTPSFHPTIIERELIFIFHKRKLGLSVLWLSVRWILGPCLPSRSGEQLFPL